MGTGTDHDFARAHPEDARLLLTVRRDDLLDADPDDAFRAQLDAVNAPLAATLTRLTRALRGRATARAADEVTRAVVDLPHAALRRHLRDAGELPSWLEHDVAMGARGLLEPPGAGERPARAYPKK